MTESVLDLARRAVGTPPQTHDATMTRLAGDVHRAKAYVLVVAQPGVEWCCDMNHRHPRPSRMTVREVNDQARRLMRDAGYDARDVSGSLLTVAVYGLIDDGYFTAADDFKFEVSEKGTLRDESDA
jgi:hypothetical protein